MKTKWKILITVIVSTIIILSYFLFHVFFYYVYVEFDPMCTSSDFVPSFRELTEKDFQEHEFLYKYIVEHKLKSNYLPYLVGINAHFYFDSEPELNYQSGFTTYGINHNGSSYLMKLDHASLPFIGDFYGQCFSNDPTNDRFWDRMSKK